MESLEALEIRVQRGLTGMGKTLATAESCSGGLIAHRITNVPGASDYFVGGVVAYSNRIKEQILGVTPGTLDQHGAVSAATAQEMAEGVRCSLGADYGLAVTGIAGPSGGSAEKPVGLVYIAVASGAGVCVTRNQFDGNREAVKQQTADAALQQLLEVLG